MTQGDYIELIVIATLYGLAFTIPLPRWRLFWTINSLSINMLAGRVFILWHPDAYAYCSALQFIGAIIFIKVSETFLGVLIGLLYAVMVIGGGLTGLGYLSPETSNGLTDNYWSVMSVATYLQFVVVMFHVFKQWHKHGLFTRGFRIFGS